MKQAAMPRSLLHWLAAAVLVAAIPHVTYLPLWASALVPAAVALRLGLRHPPGRWILVPLVLATFAAVLVQFHSIAGATAGGTFFAAMVALKFLEARDLRDAGLLVCLSYFLATSIFLTSQAIAMAAYVLGSVTLTTVALITLADPSGPPPSLRARKAALLLLQSLPIMLVLFLLFPRLPGPLWGFGNDPSAARTGLSDTMAPGSITQLVRSSDVAFRVQFDDQAPPPGRRYWRGPVLWHFDGRTWSRGDPAVRTLAPPADIGDVRRYTIIIQPHDHRWVFGLDLPLDRGGSTRRAPGYNLLAGSRIESVRRYRLESALQYRLETNLAPGRRQRALQLPADAAPRARQLAQRWRAAGGGPRAVVHRALAWFGANGFAYTLSPPALSGDPVDDFLFGTRAGFCEHYASAFVVLMRAAGIPARVVTGYLGGETDTLGGYMIVRQSDAHAWAEVWLDGAGWVRVDPTGAVSRARIETGVASVRGADASLSYLSRSGTGWLRDVALAWDSVDHAWNRLVLGYGPELQHRFLENVGLGGFGRYALAVVTMAVTGLALAAVWLLALRGGPRPDPITRAWARARSRLVRAGIVPAPAEGPHALAARVARERPDLAAPFGRIVRLYVALRYRPRAAPRARANLQREVARFRPRRTARRGGSADS